MLSAKELFKYRQALDKTVPQRGGHKDYMPDGSWLEDKKLENFNIERQRVLSEPRVQRDGDLVKGEWKPERKLVEFQKEMKNFWEHMGFIDRQRKWLYPEEALFLMETNVLEVWYNGLPLSISEGYMLFLDETLSLEYYQVFAHLRRIGFVVLRHQGRKDITKYEQQIGLDKIYLSRKERKALWKTRQKDRKIEDTTSTTEDSSNHTCESEDMEVDIDSGIIGVEGDGSKVMEDLSEQTSCIDNESELHSNSKTKNVDVEVCSSSIINGLSEETSNNDKGFKVNVISELKEDISVTQDKLVNFNNGGHGDSSNLMDNAIEQLSDNHNYIELKQETDCGQDIQESTSHILVESDEKSASKMGSSPVCISSIKEESTNNANNSVGNETRTCSWNFDEIKFPDFGIQEPFIVISQPDKEQTPDKLVTSNLAYEFDRVTLINRKKEKRRNKKDEGESSEKLKFSCSMMTDEFTRRIKSCRNWHEYKEEKARYRQSWRRKKEFPHLFEDVEPLVRPEQATSTAAVLDQLQIIKEETKDPKKNSDPPTILPHFDVYKPDTKFVKTAPRMPDHRVVVAKCSDHMPELSTIQAITSYLQDDVPLKWAVVETGNIAFYDVSQFTLPIDIPFG